MLWLVLGCLAGVGDRIIIWNRRWELERMIHGRHFVVDTEPVHDGYCDARNHQQCEPAIRHCILDGSMILPRTDIL